MFELGGLPLTKTFDIHFLAPVNSRKYLVETKEDNGDISEKKHWSRKGGKETVGNDMDSDDLNGIDRDQWYDLCENWWRLGCW